jgi:hypothetical protein
MERENWGGGVGGKPQKKEGLGCIFFFFINNIIIKKIIKLFL